jgi:hypothetical protein
LRPLRPEDFPDLYAVAADPLIWEQHPHNNRFQEEVFKKFFRDALACGGALIAIDSQSHSFIVQTFQAEADTSFAGMSRSDRLERREENLTQGRLRPISPFSYVGQGRKGAKVREKPEIAAKRHKTHKRWT